MQDYNLVVRNLHSWFYQEYVACFSINVFTGLRCQGSGDKTVIGLQRKMSDNMEKLKKTEAPFVDEAGWQSRQECT